MKSLHKSIYRSLLLIMLFGVFTIMLSACGQTKTDYKIAVNACEHGIVSVNKSTAKKGDEITVSAIPENGYELATITCDGVILSEYTFEMPAHDITISALFNLKEVEPVESEYNVTIQACEHGIVVVNKSTAKEGEQITVSATPETGYELATITCNGVILNNYIFEMPAHDVTISALFNLKVEEPVDADYTITVQTSEHGIVSVNKSIAKEGDEITVSAIPENGYELATITCDGVILSENTFEMPAHNVIISALFNATEGSTTEELINYNLGTYVCNVYGYSDEIIHYLSSSHYTSITLKENNKVDIIADFGVVVYLQDIDYTREGNKLTASAQGQSLTVQIIDENTLILIEKKEYDDITYDSISVFCYVEEDVQLPTGQFHGTVENEALNVTIASDKVTINYGEEINGTWDYVIKGDRLYIFADDQCTYCGIITGYADSINIIDFVCITSDEFTEMANNITLYSQHQ